MEPGLQGVRPRPSVCRTQSYDSNDGIYSCLRELHIIVPKITIPTGVVPCSDKLEPRLPVNAIDAWSSSLDLWTNNGCKSVNTVLKR
jgi:hypothetical protein